MLPQNLLLKLILTPCIVAVAAWVGRRWGDSVAGWMIGLPLTSGPVSFFFALEQGKAFAAHAAVGAILGVVGSATFCTAYYFGARGSRWWQGAAAALACYIPIIWLISQLQAPLGWAEALALCALVAALFLMGRPGPAPAAVIASAWDLPLRILTATTILVLITNLASALGPLWSGLLSPFPIFTFVQAIFSQSQKGTASAQHVVRGVVTGLFGYTAFFLVIGLLIVQSSIPLAYCLATLAALGVNAGSLIVMTLRRRALSAAGRA